MLQSVVKPQQKCQYKNAFGVTKKSRLALFQFFFLNFCTSYISLPHDFIKANAWPLLGRCFNRVLKLR